AVGWTLYFLLSFPVNWLIWSWRLFGGRQLLGIVLVYIACAASGWIVARLHPGHAAAFATVFAVTVFLFEYGFISWNLLRGNYPLGASPAQFIIPAARTITRPLWILIGGVAGSRPVGGAPDLVLP